MLQYTKEGFLLPGIYPLSWHEFAYNFSFSDHRILLLEGMKQALKGFKKAGCQRVYIDGSFVTIKTEPNDYDACWDNNGVRLNCLDPVLYKYELGTLKQKIKYGGEFYPLGDLADRNGMTFFEFFQYDKSGIAKGIVQINLRDMV